MLSLNILIYNKMIKKTVKPAVHIQNMSDLYILQFDVNYVLSRIKHRGWSGGTMVLSKLPVPGSPTNLE